MTKRMLIDAIHPEETRVAVVDGSRLEEFDFETEFRKQLKGNIYLAKVTRVEPSLQAAFVEYGGNRHGFLPFPEIHQDYFRIPVGDRPGSDYESDEDQDDIPFPARALNAETYGEEIEEPAGDAGMQGDEPGFSEQPPEDRAELDYHRGDYEQPDDQDSLVADDGAGPLFQEDGAGRIDDGADEDSLETDIIDADAARPVPVETVGGDEAEEMRPRRRIVAPRYKIQEVIKRRQIMLIQVSKEERGNKGAAITTFLSLPGRYCVLMPNTPRGGGVSRKIANPRDRQRMKVLIGDLEIPDGMSVILRTAGVERTQGEIKRDLDYLLRLWETIRDLTLKSTAPALVYEEGNLIKRAIRDVYSRDIDEVVVAGDTGFRQAKDFMRMMMPTHAKRVVPYREGVPLFFRHQVESQIDAIHNPVAQLRSGGYIVMNQTEALVSIDVNSGRSTRERNIEETAFKTNLEAADEIARQLRLRDLGGLVVVDFIDMEDPRHDVAVERRLKEAMKNDRARIQIGRMSPFGLLELSRQRLHPSLIESNFQTCAHCRGTGVIRSHESAAFVALRAIEEEGIKARAAEILVHMPSEIALYMLNHKRTAMADIEAGYAMKVLVATDDGLISPDVRIDRIRAQAPGFQPPAFTIKPALAPTDIDNADDAMEDSEEDASDREMDGDQNARDETGGRKRSRRRRGRRRGASDDRTDEGASTGSFGGDNEGEREQVSRADHDGVPDEQPDFTYPAVAQDQPEGSFERPERRRRGRRGGRRSRSDMEPGAQEQEPAHADAAEGPAEDTSVWCVETSPPALTDRPSFTNADMDELPTPDHAQEDLDLPEEHRHATPGTTESASIHAADDEPAPENSEPAITEASGDRLHEEGSIARPIKDYEVVNQSPETPKQGWWKRLIQQ